MATVKKPNDWLRSQKMREQSDSALERMAENERELGLDYMEQTQTATYTCGVCGVSMQMEQPAQQEPVAYAVYHRMGGGKSLHWPEQHSDEGDHNEYHLVPLYTSPQPAQQEPFGQVTVVRRPGFVDKYWFYRWPEPPYLDNAAECHMVYTSPPASKPWVGLTDEEIKSLWEFPPDQSWIESVHAAIRRAEAALKEKNA